MRAVCARAVCMHAHTPMRNSHRASRIVTQGCCWVLLSPWYWARRSFTSLEHTRTLQRPVSINHRSIVLQAAHAFWVLGAGPARRSFTSLEHTRTLQRAADEHNHQCILFSFGVLIKNYHLFRVMAGWGNYFKKTDNHTLDHTLEHTHTPCSGQ